jgi:hypothetical protein
MAKIEVYDNGGAAGAAVAFVIGRHVHPAVPQAVPEASPPGLGVDYLGLVAAAHAEALGEGSISYRSLPGMEAWGQADEAAL